jgi:hypothetical protein
MDNRDSNDHGSSDRDSNEDKENKQPLSSDSEREEGDVRRPNLGRRRTPLSFLPLEFGAPFPPVEPAGHNQPAQNDDDIFDLVNFSGENDHRNSALGNPTTQEQPTSRLGTVPDHDFNRWEYIMPREAQPADMGRPAARTQESMSDDFARGGYVNRGNNTSSMQGQPSMSSDYASRGYMNSGNDMGYGYANRGNTDLPDIPGFPLPSLNYTMPGGPQLADSSNPNTRNQGQPSRSSYTTHRGDGSRSSLNADRGHVNPRDTYLPTSASTMPRYVQDRSVQGQQGSFVADSSINQQFPSFVEDDTIGLSGDNQHASLGNNSQLPNGIAEDAFATPPDIQQAASRNPSFNMQRELDFLVNSELEFEHTPDGYSLYTRPRRHAFSGSAAEIPSFALPASPNPVANADSHRRHNPVASINLDAAYFRRPSMRSHPITQNAIGTPSLGSAPTQHRSGLGAPPTLGSPVQLPALPSPVEQNNDDLYAYGHLPAFSGPPAAQNTAIPSMPGPSVAQPSHRVQDTGDFSRRSIYGYDPLMARWLQARSGSSAEQNMAQNIANLSGPGSLVPQPNYTSRLGPPQMQPVPPMQGSSVGYTTQPQASTAPGPSRGRRRSGPRSAARGGSRSAASTQPPAQPEPAPAPYDFAQHPDILASDMHENPMAVQGLNNVQGRINAELARRADESTTIQRNIDLVGNANLHPYDIQPRIRELQREGDRLTQESNGRLAALHVQRDGLLDQMRANGAVRRGRAE